MALEVALCTGRWNAQHDVQDPPSEVDARTARGPPHGFRSISGHGTNRSRRSYRNSRRASIPLD